MTRYGFYSAVEHRQDKNIIIVRSRSRRHLERLSESNVVTSLTIEETPNADYGFRTSIQRETWQALVQWLISDLNYDNFKSAVGRDPNNSEAYRAFLHDVWGRGLSLKQEKREPRE